jgi:outer membrane biosynthesis protein TonB
MPFAIHCSRAARLLEDFVKNRILSLASIATLAVVFGMISWGSAFAQTTPSTPTDQTTPQTQPTPTPDTPPTQQTPQTQPAPTPEVPPASQQPPSSSTQTPSTQTPSSQTPDAAQTPSSKDNAPANSTPSASAPNAGATAGASDSQSFSGTVVKSGDKYMLKDDAGKTYDIDHQSDVAKFEGKRVRVQGKLDDSGSKILVK